MTKTHRLKIEDRDATGKGYGKAAPVPKIRLKGKWLEAAGFPPGMSVLVTVISTGVIELRLEGIRAVDGEYLIAADRLDVALAKDKARRKLDWIRTHKAGTDCTLEQAATAWEARFEARGGK